MQQITHQTVKLSAGKHASPEEGACVMELASMLAGEPFSDHPASVCPVIASFMRAYNDRVDDDRRDDLYEYASKAVGSRASRTVERARIARLVQCVPERRRFGSYRLLLALGVTPHPLGADFEQVALRTAATIRRHDDRAHAQALGLIDELLEIGADSECGQLPGHPARPSPALTRCD